MEMGSVGVRRKSRSQGQYIQEPILSGFGVHQQSFPIGQHVRIGSGLTATHCRREIQIVQRGQWIQLAQTNGNALDSVPPLAKGLQVCVQLPLPQGDADCAKPWALATDSLESQLCDTG